jgi:DNA polymerase-3 subunit beta
MKFRCNTETFAGAIRLVSKAVSNKRTLSMIPILEGIKIVAKGDSLIISATNIDIFIQKTIKAQILLEGETVVISKHFDEFLSRLVNIEEIELEKTEKEIIIINYGENRTEFMCADAKAYPVMQQVDDDTTFKIKAKDLKDLIEKTIFCVSQENSRPILKGALLELQDEQLSVVALDGHRLSLGSKKVTDAKGSLRKVILGKNLAELVKALEGDKQVKVNVQRNNILFDMDDTKITMMELQGEYLKYQEVIPKKSNIDLVIEKSKLIDTLERTGILARENNRNYVTMSLEGEEIIINVTGIQGRTTEKLPVKKSGEDRYITIAFNNRYLYEPISKIDEDYILMKIEQENKPIIIQAYKEEDAEAAEFLYMVLTIRI